MKKTVTLDIAGASYRMNVDADEEHLRRLAELVNQRVTALGPRAAQKATPTQLLAMAALSLADDLLALDSRCRDIEDSTRRVVASAIARIDRRLEASVMAGSVAPVDA